MGPLQVVNVGPNEVDKLTCNLTCSYCFQNESADQTHGPARIPRITLQSGTVPTIRDFVAAQMARHERTMLHLLLTGGEPLMNFAVCLELLEQMTSLNMTAAQMFTNGVLLTRARATALIGAGLTSAQVSFDGNRADHDRYRRNQAGAGSYSTILENLQAVRAGHPDFELTARINVSKDNLYGIEELLRDLQEHIGTTSTTIRLGLIDDIGIGFDGAPERSTATAERLVVLTECALELGFQVDSLASPARCLYCGIVGGGSGTVINSDGTLFSCWESVGRAGFEVGNLATGYLPREELVGRWVDCTYNVSHTERDTATLSSIQDLVDAAAFDYLYTRSLQGPQQ